MSETIPAKRVFSLRSGHLEEGQVDNPQKKKKRSKNS